MPAFIPTRMINVPDYGQIVGESGAVVTVGPWVTLALDPRECVRVVAGYARPISPDLPVAMLVPSAPDAIVNISREFQIFEVRDVQGVETELKR